MKQLLLATATLVGMSAAALAAEPVALSDSQLDKVTAGQNTVDLSIPVASFNFGAAAGPLGSVAGPSSFAANPVLNIVTAPTIPGG